MKAYFEREGIQLATLSDPLIVTAIDLTKIKVVLLDLDLLGSGADFFLSKPVYLGELCLIVNKALGRTSTNTPSSSSNWTLQRHQMCLVTPDQQTFGLSGNEFRVLEQLFRNAGEATAKEVLIEVSTGSNTPPTVQQVRSLEVLLSRLRRRFSTDRSTFPVKSLRNVGYIFHGNCKITD